MLSTKLKNNPFDLCNRTEVFNQKKKFKKVVKRKKYEFKSRTLSKMTELKNELNQKEFWKMLNKLASNKTKTDVGTSGDFLTHFKSMLTTDADQTNVPVDNNIGPLDDRISKEELKQASVILKPGKATWKDNISNEMITCLITSHPELVLKLFNSVMQSNEIVPDWTLGIIVPIHKKGSKNDPSNYRGITLMSCLGKLFLSILNNRLLQFTRENKILSDTQLGFVAGNRTSDAHIIINNLIRKYCHENKSKLFSCFVDFSKAFDTIPRDILLRKIHNYGITGRVFNIIRDIYIKDKSCVNIGYKYTMDFNINLGVRQGCVLSPLLFNMFMAVYG